MKNRDMQATDYQALIMIGITFLLVGLLAVERRLGNTEGYVFYYFFAMYLFVRAYFSYHGRLDLLEESQRDEIS